MRRGYKAVSITDIIEAARITKPTLYAYFAGKEDLFVRVVLHAIERLGSDVASVAPDEEFATQLLGVAKALLRYQEYDVRLMRREMAEHLPREASRRLNEAFFRQVLVPVHALMERGIERGELAPRDALQLAGLFLSILDGAHGQRSEAESVEWSSTPISPELIVDIFLHGAGATRF
jgi:TetR/AcrR family transcriptional regulator